MIAAHGVVIRKQLDHADAEADDCLAVRVARKGVRLLAVDDLQLGRVARHGGHCVAHGEQAFRVRGLKWWRPLSRRPCVSD
jgi:hypothetical protein